MFTTNLASINLNYCMKRLLKLCKRINLRSINKMPDLVGVTVEMVLFELRNLIIICHYVIFI